MGRFGPEVQDVLEPCADDYLASHAVSAEQARVISDLRACRTAALGGHVDRCCECEAEYVSYNSCRNRHCPKCQGLAREEWPVRREAELVEVGHYHAVLAVPAALNPVFLRNQRETCGLLFRAAWETVAHLAPTAGTSARGPAR